MIFDNKAIREMQGESLEDKRSTPSQCFATFQRQYGIRRGEEQMITRVRKQEKFVTPAVFA